MKEFLSDKKDNSTTKISGAGAGDEESLEENSNTTEPSKLTKESTKKGEESHDYGSADSFDDAYEGYDAEDEVEGPGILTT